MKSTLRISIPLFAFLFALGAGSSIALAAAIPGNCQQEVSGDNCGSGRYVVNDGCAPAATVQTWADSCAATPGSYLVCANTLAAGPASCYIPPVSGPTCSCPVGQSCSAGGTVCNTCASGYTGYDNDSNPATADVCVPVRPLVFDTAKASFRSYTGSIWDMVSNDFWKVSGNNIYNNFTNYPGNVGIGTSTPARALDVASDGGIRIKPSALPTTPAPGAGDIAVDSSNANNLKWYNGSEWKVAGSVGWVDASTAASPETYSYSKTGTIYDNSHTPACGCDTLTTSQNCTDPYDSGTTDRGTYCYDEYRTGTPFIGFTYHWVQWIKTVHPATTAQNRINTDYSIGTPSPAQNLEFVTNLLTKGSDGFNASGESASLYLGDTNNWIRSTNGGKTDVVGWNGVRLLGGSTPRDLVVADPNNVNLNAYDNGTIKLKALTSETDNNGDPLGTYREFDMAVFTAGYDGGNYYEPGYTELGADGSNVGIGTNTPKSKLDVEGGVAIGGTYSGTTAAPANGLIVEGNVGIGNNNPSQKLNIKQSGSSWDSGLGISYSSTTWKLLADGDGTMFTIAPNNDYTKSIVNKNGSVGIGTSTPTTKLDVAGTLRASGKASFNGGVGIDGNVSMGASGETVSIGSGIFENKFSYNSGAGLWTLSGTYLTGSFKELTSKEKMNAAFFIAGSGMPAGCGWEWANHGYSFEGDGCWDSGMFSDTDGKVNLCHNGNCSWSVSSAGVFAMNTSQYSDRRIKENIQSYGQGLDALMQINPVTFDYNGLGGSDKGQRGIGVIAQDLQKVLPEAIHINKTKLNPTDAGATDLLAVDNSVLPIVAINAIKEQQAMINTLKQNSEAQQSKIDELSRQIEGLKAQFVGSR